MLSLCLVPWTLSPSPLVLPKHHLLAMSLLRSGGSRMGSSSGTGKATEEQVTYRLNEERLGLAGIKDFCLWVQRGQDCSCSSPLQKWYELKRQIRQQSSAPGDKTGLGSNLHEFTGGSSDLLPRHGLLRSWLRKWEMDPFLHGIAAFRACSFLTPLSALALSGRQSRACGSAGHVQKSIRLRNTCASTRAMSYQVQTLKENRFLWFLWKVHPACACVSRWMEVITPQHTELDSWIYLRKRKCLPPIYLFSQMMAEHWLWLSYRFI